MTTTSELRDRARRGLAALGAIGLALLLMGSSKGSSAPECGEPIPDDAFSERIESLLVVVEGFDFPSRTNLGTWPERRAAIQESFAEILALVAEDPSRRRAAVEALIAAEILTADPREAGMFSQGPERGEVRAWARHALRRYASKGVTSRDLKFLDADLISSLQNLWDNPELSHPERDLPFYQEKAQTLRNLATFRSSPSCD